MYQKAVELQFSEIATIYAKYRPGYPPVAIEQIINDFPCYRTLKAVDMGAGTGISSRLLANRGLTVTAIEPDSMMIKAATPHPKVKFLQARAESTGLPDHSADIVTSFQSFHWFDFKSSLLEFHRILKSDGRLCLIWSYWDVSDEFTRRYNDILINGADKNPNRVSPYDSFPDGYIKQNRIRILWKFHYLPCFRNIRRYQFSYKQKLNLDGLIGCARSQSFVPKKGPAWEEIIYAIVKLTENRDTVSLKYNTNLFICQPKKKSDPLARDPDTFNTIRIVKNTATSN